MADVLVVGSKVRKAIKKQKMNMSGDFIAALSKEVSDMVTRACNTAKAYGKKTVSKQAFGLKKR